MTSSSKRTFVFAVLSKSSASGDFLDWAHGVDITKYGGLLYQLAHANDHTYNSYRFWSPSFELDTIILSGGDGFSGGQLYLLLCFFVSICFPLQHWFSLQSQRTGSFYFPFRFKSTLPTCFLFDSMIPLLFFFLMATKEK